MKRLYLPLTRDVIKTLKPVEKVFLNGGLLTARDAAHKRLSEALGSGRKIPVCIKGETIYYTGPTPAKKGQVIGSCGPTTSGRMDPFTPVLLRHGLLGMIGKGERSERVVSAIRRFGAIYFIAVGGAGAYLSERVVSSSVVAYEDLGTEAVRRLVIRDFPVFAAIR